MDIIHDNIFYVTDISELGGVETFVYELAKKYKENDIAVVCKYISNNQLERLLQICPVYIHTNQTIKCKLIITNYDDSILEYLDESLKPIVVETIHADYTANCYKYYPVINPRVDKWYGITKHICKTFSDKFKVQTELCYNPLSYNIDERPLILISATRLSPIKGKDRMALLAHKLDQAGVNYIWYIFTNDKDAIPSSNIIYMNPRLDVNRWICQADYLVQLSDTEACSYSILESLYRNIPIIVTPLPYLEEIGVKDNINSYIMEFDCSNIDEIVSKINNVPKFTFKQLEDNYDSVIIKGKSKYKEEKNMRYLVEATNKYTINKFEDTELSRIKGESFIPEKGYRWEVDSARKRLLETNGYITVVEQIKESTDNIDKKVKEAVIEDLPEIEEQVLEAKTDEEVMKELKKLKKADLLEEARKMDIDISESKTKDDIINAIIGAKNEQ